MNNRASAGRRTSVSVVGLDVSFNRLDGGGRRVQAFLRALDAHRLEVEPVGVGPCGIEGARRTSASRIHKLKRRMLPIQLRRPIDAELARLECRGPTISLTPAAHRWALSHRPAWIDYPDLWSNIAGTHAETVDVLSALTSRAQARLWSHRETAESVCADVVSVASWTDARQLGPCSVWLPTPVSESGFDHPPRSAAVGTSGVVYGMLANFDYPPNRDAYEHLVRHWIPVLAPSAERVIVAGFGSESLPPVASVDILGTVADVLDFYERVDVVVAPIYLGGGMKVKVVEAMMHGKPVVASEHARSGLPASIADGCISWERSGAQFGEPSYAAGLRDPRDNSAVLRELGHFTLDSFIRTCRKLWDERMADA